MLLKHINSNKTKQIHYFAIWLGTFPFDLYSEFSICSHRSSFWRYHNYKIGHVCVHINYHIMNTFVYNILPKYLCFPNTKLIYLYLYLLQIFEILIFTTFQLRMWLKKCFDFIFTDEFYWFFEFRIFYR